MNTGGVLTLKELAEGLGESYVEIVDGFEAVDEGYPNNNVPLARGESREHYCEGQEEQLGALGLVVNALVLGNSRSTGLALERLRADGEDVSEVLVARLSMLAHLPVNMLGRYNFVLAELLARGALRLLGGPREQEDGIP